MRVVGLVAIGHASRGRAIVWHPRGVSRAAICWAVWQGWLQWGGIGMAAFEDDLDLHQYVGWMSVTRQVYYMHSSMTACSCGCGCITSSCACMCSSACSDSADVALRVLLCQQAQTHFT